MGPCLDIEQAAAYVDGLLSRDDTQLVESHIDSCPDCRRMISDAARADARSTPSVRDSSSLSKPGSRDSHVEHGQPRREECHEPERLNHGSLFGRFVVLDCLGAGAMGVVYSAYDPQLDRKVALKLHGARASGPPEDHARMLRESRAMAQLVHPHVVSVHDAGTVDGRAFIAMQLVTGCSLKEWLRRERRSWRAVLSVMCRAGAGLCAAHDAGIVHRDFKPDNVLIDETDSPRVSDFGLARAGLSQALPDDVTPMPSPVDAHQTRTGTLLGTPAYMSPEQMTGHAATPRSDQFSFCVTLYEALYGDRPFAGENLAEVRAAISASRFRSPSRRIPRWLRQAVLRGLAADPADRYASMHELLRALATTRHLRLRLAGMGMALLAAALVFAYRFGPEQKASCAEAASRLEATAWNEEARSAIRTSFAAASPQLADAAFDGVARSVTGFLSAWRGEAVAACEASRSDAAPVELLAARQLCLDRRLFAARALLAVFAQADSQVVERAVKAAHELPRLEDCFAAQPSGAEPPADSAGVATQMAADEATARAFALAKTGKYQLAIDEVERALAPEPPTDWQKLSPATRARLLLWKGTAEGHLAKREAAFTTLRQSALLAEQGRDPETAVRAYVELVYLSAVRRLRPDAAELFMDQAEASRALLDKNDELAGLVERAHSWMAFQAREMHEALTHSERALHFFERSVGADHPLISAVLVDIGNAQTVLGKNREGIAAHERALATGVRLLGEHHPEVFALQHNLGYSYMYDGQFEKALEYSERAYAGRRVFFGAESPLAADSLSNLGEGLTFLGRHEEARARLQQAIEVLVHSYGEKHARVALARVRLGRVLVRLNQTREAALEMERVLAAIGDGPDSPEPELSCEALLTIGELQLAGRHYDEALRYGKRARAALRRPELSTGQIVRIDFLAARVLWARGETTEALALARQARDRLSDDRGHLATERRAVAEFLARNGGE